MRGDPPQLLQGWGLVLSPACRAQCAWHHTDQKCWGPVPGLASWRPLLGACGPGQGTRGEHWAESETWVIISMLMLESCVTLAKFLFLSGPQMVWAGLPTALLVLSFYNLMRCLVYPHAIEPQTLCPWGSLMATSMGPPYIKSSALVTGE